MSTQVPRWEEKRIGASQFTEFTIISKNHTTYDLH